VPPPKLNKTVFSTPLISGFFRSLSLLMLRLTGWRIVGETPDIKKFVLIGAPHTSNWDFVVMLAGMFYYRIEVRWMGKDSLFRFPFGGFMKWLGGIPIDRSKANTVVSQMVEVFAHNDELVLLITPEGTRSKVERWKSGFYHIARGAEVPVLMGYIDFAKKEAGLHDWFQPGGDYDSDLEQIQAFYAAKTPRHPENF
jgi:1-acyl-sn-glycerol-3-phosphate acyltransferase